LLPLPGTPVLGSLLREYSGLRVCSKLSWLVWDAEDSLEFYPAQASQSFFSMPRSLRPRNRESSQQRQGARRAEETGR
ncbi:hypothetical protein Taro_052486, partial [Colocasia esculenta]|nr:hypothetical protein [Colocasia esculenta]